MGRTAAPVTSRYPLLTGKALLSACHLKAFPFSMCPAADLSSPFTIFLNGSLSQMIFIVIIDPSCLDSFAFLAFQPLPAYNPFCNNRIIRFFRFISLIKIIVCLQFTFKRPVPELFHDQVRAVDPVSYDQKAKTAKEDQKEQYSVPFRKIKSKEGKT